MIFPQSIFITLLATSWSVQGHTVVRVSFVPSSHVFEAKRLVNLGEWCRSRDRSWYVSIYHAFLSSIILTAAVLAILGVRVPPNNGPVGPGYNSSPVKNLTSIDLRCNVLGDTQVPDTISVAPGDIVSFEWFDIHSSHTSYSPFQG